MSEGPIPKSWQEAAPVITWGVLILGAGLEFITTLVHAEWWSCLASFVLLVAMTAALIHWRQLRQWGSLAYALATLLIVISVRSPLLDRVLPKSGQTALLVDELEAQKATLIEWLQQTQRERDEAQKQMRQSQSRPAMLTFPVHPEPTKAPDPQVCADLLHLLSNLSAEKHAWHGDEDVRSVMKNLGCFAPAK
jgi:thiol:disulfide interchange protein